jgi:hypothetical protein
MKYRFVTQNGTIEIVAETVEVAIARASVEGFEFVRLNDNRLQRQELQGQPRFNRIMGPMWDGDAIRYECPQTYERLSA